MSFKITEWFYMPQYRPNVATSDDGRVKIWDDKGACLILPAPAADILRDIEAREAVRASTRDR
jgi:hypothetical protein